MKKSEFPEKLYEALVLHELLQFVPIGSTPALCVPSQFLEKKLGFDLCFVDSNFNPIKRKVIMIQFKISHEYTKKKIGTHFKIELYSRDRYFQHNKLCNYNLYGSGVVAIYCAPRFITYKELLAKIASKNIIGDSAFIKPKTHIYDTKYHYITFDSTRSYQHSKECFECTTLNFEEILENTESISKDTFVNNINNMNDIEEESFCFKKTSHTYDGQYFIFF